MHSPLTDEPRYQRPAHAALLDAIEAGDSNAAPRRVEGYLGAAVGSVHRLTGPDAGGER